MKNLLILSLLFLTPSILMADNTNNSTSDDKPTISNSDILAIDKKIIKLSTIPTSKQKSNIATNTA